MRSFQEKSCKEKKKKKNPRIKFSFTFRTYDVASRPIIREVSSSGKFLIKESLYYDVS